MAEESEVLAPVKLKAVVLCSFVKSELTNLREFQEHRSYPGDLKPGEVFLFLSRGGNQVIFILDDTEVVNGHAYPTVDSRRWRMEGGTWDPMMMQEYAGKVKLHLKGIKSFKEGFEAMQARKKMRPAQRAKAARLKIS